MERNTCRNANRCTESKSNFGPVLAAFILVLFMAGALFADISVTSYTVLPSEVRPGSSGAIAINIANSGAVTVSGIELQATATGPVDSSANIFVGDMSPGGSTVITVPFTVKANATPGVYTFQASLLGFSESVSTSGQTEMSFTRRIFTAPITVTNPVIFQITSGTETVFTDDDFVARGTLAKNGGAAKSVRLSINSSSFIQTGENPLFLGDVTDGKPFALNLTIAQDVPSGKYSLPLAIVYRDEIGTERTSVGYLTVNVNRRTPDFVISVSPVEGTKTVPGERTKLRVTVKNIGNSDANSVRVALEKQSTLTTVGFSETALDRLAAGAETGFYLDAGVNSIAPGFYPLSFSVRYDNKNGEEQIPKIVTTGIDVSARNDMSFFVSGRPTPITAGDPATLSVLVSNVGSSQVKALWVRATSKTFKIIDAENKQFIGALEADDFSTVQFKVLVADVPDGTYPLEVTANFKDAFNIEHSYTQNVSIAVVSKATAAQSAGSSNGYTTYCIAAVALVVVLGGAYFGYKRFVEKKEKR